MSLTWKGPLKKAGVEMSCICNCTIHLKVNDMQEDYLGVPKTRRLNPDGPLLVIVRLYFDVIDGF